MTYYRFPLAMVVFWLVLFGLMTGCQRKPESEASKEGKLAVTVSLPVERYVSNYLYYTGSTEAVESVEVKARVSGYLVQVAMKPNSVVRGPESPLERAASTVSLLGSPLAAAPLLTTVAQFPGRGKGAVLFSIDPRPYQAALDQATGQVLLAEAKLVFAKKQQEMAKDVAQKNPDAISKLQIETYNAALDEAAASLKAVKASLEAYKLDLEFTEVTAPVEGRVSKNYLTIGNLVTKDQSILTSIKSEDPIYVYFDMDEQTFLDIRKMIEQGKIKSFAKGMLPVDVGRSTDKDDNGNPTYPYGGNIDFVNNKVDPTTGTITVRAVCPNHRSSHRRFEGPRPFLPGFFVRIRLPLGDPYPALLVTDKALVSEQGKKYLLMVDDKNVVQKRLVTLGPLQADGLRVITSGVAAKERVLINRLQEATPGKEVVPTVRNMPFDRPPGQAAAAAGRP
jgi:multidrug efflux system membrane fusion protein